MHYLIDTGVLLRLFDGSDPQCASIRQALRVLRRQRHVLCVTQQNIAEFWNVSTRPSTSRGGYGHSVSTTDRRVRFIESLGLVLSESKASYAHWRNLVTAHGISGVSVHDARLVAIMMASHIANLLTLNAEHFQRYRGLVVLTPDEVR